MTKKLPIILATESKYKQQILSKLGLPFTAIAPKINESPLPNERPQEIVERLAIAKAQKLAETSPTSYIIGADQVASFNGQIIGKPHTIDNAVAQLSQFSDQIVTFYTGVSLFDWINEEYFSCVDTYNVHFRKLTRQDIEHYIAIESPLDCAGSFKSEGLGILLFSKLEGRDPNALIGLPLIALAELFTKANVSLLSHCQR